MRNFLVKTDSNILIELLNKFPDKEWDWMNKSKSSSEIVIIG